MKTLSEALATVRAHCSGRGYWLVWDAEEQINWRRDCRGCHDCKPNEYTKSHYKKRKPKGEREDG